MTNFYDSVVGCGHPRDRHFAALADGRHYSYGDVEAVSARFANVLAEWGIKVGDRVAAQVPKSIEAVMLYLAAVRAGAVFLPLALVARELERMSRADSDPFMPHVTSRFRTLWTLWRASRSRPFRT